MWNRFSCDSVLLANDAMLEKYTENNQMNTHQVHQLTLPHPSKLRDLIDLSEPCLATELQCNSAKHNITPFKANEQRFSLSVQHMQIVLHHTIHM